MKSSAILGETIAKNKVRIDDLYEKIHETIENWPEWKKQAYNDNFAISNYSRKLNILNKK